jgi:hypothetical protein
MRVPSRSGATVPAATPTTIPTVTENQLRTAGIESGAWETLQRLGNSSSRSRTTRHDPDSAVAVTPEARERVQPVADLRERFSGQVIVPLPADGFVAHGCCAAQHLQVLGDGWTAQLELDGQVARRPGSFAAARRYSGPGPTTLVWVSPSGDLFVGSA